MSHVVIENAISPHVLRAANASWPPSQWPHWHLYNGGKRATKDITRIPMACWEALRQLSVIDVHAWFSRAGHVFPDFDCHGAGLHVIPSGGRLGRHLDSDHHPLTGWARVLSAVLFVNKPIGGELVIRDKVIEPEFNRLVLFETLDDSWHEVKEVRGEEERRTMAMFWWSQDSTKRARSSAYFVD